MEEQQQCAFRIRILTGVIARSAIDALEARLREAGVPLSHLQFGLLHMIRGQAMPLTELSRRFQRAPSTLVPAIDGLEERGYIRRERDPQDRRRHRIVLTDSGEAVIEALHRKALEHDPVHQAVLQRPIEEIRALVTQLEQLVRQLPEGDQALEIVDDRIRAFDRDHQDTAPSEPVESLNS